MPNLPFNKRINDVFVSYSHSDAERVAPLVQWLHGVAGLRVWWDRDLVAGRRLSRSLPEGIGNSRAALFCVSRSWNGSTWCEDEFNAALQERRADRRYQLIAVQLEDCPVPTFLANSYYLEMSRFDTSAASKILLSLDPEPAPWPHGERDIYLSRSWSSGDSGEADRICAALTHQCGFRLIGDSPDRKDFADGTRIRHIMQSCGALVAVLPLREHVANLCTSPWIVKEIEAARELGLPYLVFAAEGVKLAADLVEAAIARRVFPLPAGEEDLALMRPLGLLEEDYRPAVHKAYSFLASSLRANPDEMERAISVVQNVTCMECLIGQRLQGQHAQREIIDRIKHAEFVIADISSNHVNSLIEAGIARGADTRLDLICRLPSSGELSTRFMFRDIEVQWYGDDLERIGVIHRIARKYRRQVYHPGPI